MELLPPITSYTKKLLLLIKKLTTGTMPAAKRLHARQPAPLGIKPQLVIQRARSWLLSIELVVWLSGQSAWRSKVLLMKFDALH